MEIVNHFEGVGNLPVLAQEEYLNSLNGVASIGYFVEDDKVLPFTIRKKAFFKWIQLDNVVYGSSTEEETKIFLDKVVAYAKKNLKVSHIASTNTAIFDNYPTGSLFCKFGTYLVDLSLTEEELFANLHSKHRNVVRKAQTEGVIVEHGQDKAVDAINLMQDTFSRQNKVSGLGLSMIKQMEPLGDMVDYWVAKDADGTLQGSAILLWNKGNSCYYMHGGSAPHTKPGAMNLLMWEAMKCMKERGVKWFDFVGARVTTEPGSKLEGIQRFKSRFGATMKVGYMFRVVVNKPYYWLYKKATTLAFYALTRKKFRDMIQEEREKGNC